MPKISNMNLRNKNPYLYDNFIPTSPVPEITFLDKMYLGKR